jgi:hypothetical protein
MTRTPFLPTDLLADCHARGIRLALAPGDGLAIDAPQDALTPDLLGRLKAHKPDLLVMLRPEAELGTCEDCGQALTETPTFDGFLNLECPRCDRCFGCRPSTGEIAARFAGAPQKAIPVVVDESQAIGEVVPCPKCCKLELWQTAADDLFGLTPGRWRCVKCEPPTDARRLAEAAERIRRRANRRTITRHNG